MEHYIKAQLDGLDMKLVRMYRAFEGDTRVIGRDNRGVDHRFSVHWLQDKKGNLKPVIFEMEA